jgi:ERO1-like protein beta
MNLAACVRALFTLIVVYSPQLNANLLQRSEVVALINTLHRFSESLHAVEVFRRLWRESNAEELEKLIREAENAVNTPVRSAEGPAVCF